MMSNVRENQTYESIAVSQLYFVSVLLLVATASLFAFNALDLIDVGKVLVTCSALIGLYSLVLTLLSGQQSLSVLVAAGLLIALPFAPYLHYLVLLFGILGLIVLIRSGLKFGLRDLLPLPILFIAIFGSGIYADFQYQNALVGDLIHIDTYFHAAITAMYSNYGVASLGFDGLVPITYHTLSHKILSAISILSGLDALATYSYLYFSMGPLLLAFSIAGFSCQLDNRLKFNQALLGTALLLLAIVAVFVFRRVAVWDTHFTSESQLIALVFLLASLSSLIKWMEEDASSLWQLSAALLLLIAAALCKGSMAVIGLCVFGLFGITRYRSLKYWMLLTATTGFIYLGVIDSASASKAHISIAIFNFPLTWVKVPYATPVIKVIIFICIHFLSVWACFFMGLKKLGSAYFNTIEFQMLFALFIPALFFTLTLQMGAGNVYYFSNIPIIVSFAILLPNLSSGLNRIKFKHVILIAMLATLILRVPLEKRILMHKSQLNEVNIDNMKDIVKQLQDVRRNSKKDTFVKIKNPEFLVNMIGCKSYWFLPAVMERPVVEGIPSQGVCKGYDGTYGLSDYKNLKEKSGNFEVIEITLGRRNEELQ
jgi:hypothetical protein